MDVRVMVFIGIQHIHGNQDTVKHADGWHIDSKYPLFGKPGELRRIADLIELAVDLGLLHAKELALAHLEADIAQGPQLAANALAVVGAADFEQGGGLPPNPAWRRASSARANLLSSKRAWRKWINTAACSRINRSGSRPGPRR
jgi:hypothetical protein